MPTAKEVAENAKENTNPQHPIREEILQLFHEEINTGVPLVIQPLDEEPEVEHVAVKIFLAMMGDNFDRSFIVQQCLALQARHLALLLHGYLREEIPLEDMPQKVWGILIQYQMMPLGQETFEVTAPTEEIAIDLAREACQLRYNNLGIVRAINGLPVEEEKE